MARKFKEYCNRCHKKVHPIENLEGSNYFYRCPTCKTLLKVVNKTLMDKRKKRREE